MFYFFCPDDDLDPRRQRPRDATFLNLYLTVEPPLSAPPPPRERLDCGEEGEELVRACDRWRREMANRFPDRSRR